MYPKRLTIVERWPLAHGKARFVTTGSASAMKHAAKKAFGFDVPSITKVKRV